MVGLIEARAATMRCWTKYSAPSATTRSTYGNATGNPLVISMAADFDRSRPNDIISCLPYSDWYKRGVERQIAGNEPRFEQPHQDARTRPRPRRKWAVQHHAARTSCRRNTRNMMMKTGICATRGRHEAMGLTLCSW